MRELQTIFAEYEKARAQDIPAVLATLVRLNGSAYRRPGAHMLVLANGKHFGSVIGACLERDLIENCKNIMNSASPAQIVHYDTSHDDDEIIGSGSGCTGQVHVLIEKLDHNDNPLLLMQTSTSRECIDKPVNQSLTIANNPNDAFLSLETSSKSNGTHLSLRSHVKRTALLTVIKRDAESLSKEVKPLRMLVNASTNKAAFIDFFQQLHLEDSKSVIDCANNLSERALLTNRFSSAQIIQRQIFDIFAEPLAVPKRLLIFGAGYDAEALVKQAAYLGYRVEVYDHRKAMADESRFPEAASVYHCRYESETFPLVDQNTFCVLMSHNLLVDKTVLLKIIQRIKSAETGVERSSMNSKNGGEVHVQEKCAEPDLQSVPAYLGILGPKRRTDRIFAQLKEERLIESIPIDIHAPIGLDLGAETPEEIALSILAEIQAISQSRRAGFLAESDQPIHETYYQSPSEEFSTKAESGIECQISP